MSHSYRSINWRKTWYFLNQISKVQRLQSEDCPKNVKMASLMSAPFHSLKLIRTRTQLTVALPIFRIELPTKKSFRKIFVIKLSNLNFRESLLSYFSAITYISAVIGIWDPFPFLPRSSATVKLENSSPNFRHLIMNLTVKSI